MSRALLSTNLRHLRQQQGWSQEILAEHCGLHRTYIGAVERGERNISLDNLERLAEALGVTLCELLDAQTHYVRDIAGYYQTQPSNCNVSTAICYL
ncbi:Transcriptional regulator, MerR family [hydrothermal vent metagenome]|uniref:Transcriptional regulator, MerR family n=1 Tax=hydrothermal vent metagenome TaxID=652676 RepID=A0A3B0YQS4_9ZZZZ